LAHSKKWDGKGEGADPNALFEIQEKEKVSGSILTPFRIAREHFTSALSPI
jgi:hypothetical protein